MIMVLLVDDDMLALSGLRKMMPWKKYGMEVVGDAANGQKALDFLETHEVDLAMVDLTMPIMDGFEFIRKCRARHPHIQYIVMTFHEDFEYVRAVLRLGVIDYISKLKLESEDCEAIFAEVAKRMADSTDEFEQPETYFCADFRRLLWLYEDSCMESLIRNLREKHPSINDVATMISDAMVRVENSIGVPPMITKRMKNIEQCIEFLVQYRTYVTRAARNGVDTLDARILVVADYINIHYRETLRVQTASDLVNLSRSYLSNSFSKRLGISLNEFIRRKRIFEAQKMIRNSSTSLQAIASEVG